jgi:outer membrane protein, heavy metal efflux system
MFLSIGNLPACFDLRGLMFDVSVMKKHFPSCPGVLSILLVVAMGPNVSGQAGLNLRGPLDTTAPGTQPGNAPGMAISRTPRNVYQRNDMQVVPEVDQLQAKIISDMIPREGVVDAPQGELGDLQNGLSLARAEEMMFSRNLDIVAARSEIEQARADIVTAGLRSNPLFFADMQQTPYRILGPRQVDVNFAIPVDVSGKRRTRVKSASAAYRAVEWKYANFIRLQRDNLQTLFVDTLAAQLAAGTAKSRNSGRERTLKHAKTAFEKAEQAYQDALNNPNVGQGDRDKLKAVMDKRQRDLRFARDDKEADDKSAGDAASQWRDQRNLLAKLLVHPSPETISLRGWLDDGRLLPPPDSVYPKIADAGRRKIAKLTEIALCNRPDFQAQRWLTVRAQADVEAVKAAKWDDVSFLVQPYTFLEGPPAASAWAVGVTVPLPIFNQQQGNLVKAQQIVVQTNAVTVSLEKSIRAEVIDAYNTVNDAVDDVHYFQKVMNQYRDNVPSNIYPDARATETADMRAFLVTAEPALRRLTRDQRRQDRANFLGAIIKHRKALLRLNTATGRVVVPESPNELPTLD